MVSEEREKNLERLHELKREIEERRAADPSLLLYEAQRLVTRDTSALPTIYKRNDDALITPVEERGWNDWFVEQAQQFWTAACEPAVAEAIGTFSSELRLEVNRLRDEVAQLRSQIEALKRDA